MIDLFEIAAWIGAVTCIVTFVFAICRVFRRNVTARLNSQEHRLCLIEAWTRKQQNDIIDSMQERKLLLGATRASLEALRDGHANGNVQAAISDINEYIDSRAHQSLSTMD